MFEDHEPSHPIFLKHVRLAEERAEERTEARTLQRVLRQLLAAQGIPANDAALESADLDTLNAWVTDLVRGTVPEAVRG